MANRKQAKDDLYIRNGNGGGFWTTKQEYEETLAGQIGLEIGEGEDPERDRQIKYNHFDGLFQGIKNDFDYSSHNDDFDVDDVDARLKSLKKEITDYITERHIQVEKHKNGPDKIGDYYLNRLNTELHKMQALVNNLKKKGR